MSGEINETILRTEEQDHADGWKWKCCTHHDRWR